MKLLAIDGNSILNRAFFGVRLLTAKDGTYTNAIFGFLNILLKLEKEVCPDATAIAFDVSRKNFRHERYAEYKSNRKGMPEELAVQLPLIKEILTALGYRLASCEGYEGDDVLGTLAARCDASGEECIIATGDRDCLQLVTDRVSVSMQKTKESILYTPDRFTEEYGFAPKQIIDLKALMGDASDHIPGVPGIGEKTAMTLVQTHGAIEQIYADVDAVCGTERVKKLLREGQEMAFMSKELATIVTDAPIDTTLSDYVRAPMNVPVLRELLTRLELYSFLDKFGLASPDAPAPAAVPAKVHPVEVFDPAPTLQIASALADAHTVSVLYADGWRIAVGDTVFLPEEESSAMQALFSSCKPIRTFAAKSLYKCAWELGFSTVNVCFDAELAAYLLSPNARNYDVETLRLKYLDNFSTDADASVTDLVSLAPLCEELASAMEKDGLTQVFTEIEMPLCEVLASMEVDGFAVDRAGVEAFGARLENDIRLTKEQIYRLAGEEFNVNSTRELGRILFEKLGLPAKKKTATGYSTDAAVLESLMDRHEIVPQILEYRKLTKLQSTYVVGLLKVLGPDGRVHSTFNQTETRTGRISSAEPNVQNIPVRTPLGSEMRRFFVAREGYALVDADYSQIELRILAHMANDANMIAAFKAGTDIHAMTASQVFGYPIETLPSELRSRAKAINFGIVYGIGAYSLSQQIHVSMGEAKDYIEAYLRTYSGVAEYQKRMIAKAHAEGYVSTIYGRRRDLVEIRSKNKMQQAFAERVAMNMPVQGTAADIIKLAMIRVYHRLAAEKLDAKLILQVHDELIVEARQSDVEAVSRVVKEEMERAASLSVPLIAELSVGKNWYESK